MATKNSRRLVIDASIAKSSGETTHPDSIRARAFLEDVLHVCHKAVFNSKLTEEWDKHQSRFARRWRTRMALRGKLREIEPARHGDVSTVLQNLTPNSRAWKAAEKDAHLPTLALSADGIVASHDREVRTIYSARAAELSALASIIWLDPLDLPEGESRKWLSAGCKPRPEWCLGYEEPTQ